jgi:hypothetical protein
MEVIAGLFRHWSRTSLPMKPVLPKRMTLMLDYVEKCMIISKNERSDERL